MMFALFLFGGVVLFGACQPEFLPAEDLQKYIQDNDNGLTVTKEYNRYKATVSYKPTDLLIFQENGNSNQITTAEYKKLNEKYGRYDYFILSLSKENKEALYASGSQGQFSDLVQTLSFRMGQFVNMTTSEKDTLEVADYIFSRTYGMGGASSLLFVFNKEKSKHDEWIQFNLREFGMGLGRQTFRFRREDIESTPKINFEYSKE